MIDRLAWRIPSKEGILDSRVIANALIEPSQLEATLRAGDRLLGSVVSK
jgi:hypothetical protein